MNFITPTAQGMRVQSYFSNGKYSQSTSEVLIRGGSNCSVDKVPVAQTPMEMAGQSGTYL